MRPSCLGVDNHKKKEERRRDGPIRTDGPKDQGIRRLAARRSANSGEEVRQRVVSWTEPWENREHQTFLLKHLRLGLGDLAAQDGELLAQGEQLDGARAE